MAQDIDLLVAGGGLAGLAAANRAVELGQHVVVLEAATDPHHECASRVNGGCFHVAFRNIATNPVELVEAIDAITHGFADPALAQAIAINAARAVRWLKDMGVEITRIPPYDEWKQCVLAPYGGFQENTSFVWQGFGPDRLIERLERRCQDNGARVLRGTRLTGLIVEDGRCRGVTALAPGGRVEMRARDVVLADGGFEGNPKMLRRFVTPHPENVKLRGVPAGQGDGIRAAEAAGAKLVGMESFYGHIMSADSLSRDGLSPFPFLEFLASSGMMLDGSGERFVDETTGGHYTSNILARHGNGRAMVIFDDAMWNGIGRHFLCPPNPNLEKAGGTLYRADDLDTLAELAGLPRAALRRQIEAHNTSVAAREADAASSAGERQQLTPYAQGKHLPERFARAPYYAAPACAGITYTFGGIAINAQARVLSKDGVAIPGLYAAGAACGGIEGGPHVGYIGGLIKALVLGLIAAETSAALAKA